MNDRTPQKQQRPTPTVLFGWHEANQALVFLSPGGPVGITVDDLLRHPANWHVTSDGLRAMLPRVDPSTIALQSGHMMQALDYAEHQRRRA